MTLVILIVASLLGFAVIGVWVGIRELNADRELAVQFNRALDRVLHEE